MTELLHGAVEVRVNGRGLPAALRMDGSWRDVVDIALTWRVETDWWRSPVRRDYVRCLISGGDCVDIYRDLEDGTWAWVRRYD
jgi:hypothetical protein